MSVFNRVVLVILLILLILLSATIIVLPEQSFQVWANIGTTFQTLTADFVGRLIMTLILLALIVIFLLVIWLELRRHALDTVRVEKVAGGEARVAVDSVVQRVQYHVSQLPNVLRVKPSVSTKGKRVDLHLDVETTQNVNIPAKSEEISQLARTVIEQQMGLKLGKVVVTVRHAPGPHMEYQPVRQPETPLTRIEPQPAPTPKAEPEPVKEAPAAEAVVETPEAEEPPADDEEKKVEEETDKG